MELATCTAEDSKSLATRLAHFGRFLAAVDPGLDSLAGLDRQRHIETYLAAVAAARQRQHGRADHGRGTAAPRIITVASFLNDIAEWGWHDAPARRLVFPGDIPRLPRPLPRYLPADADRRLGEA